MDPAPNHCPYCVPQEAQSQAEKAKQAAAAKDAAALEAQVGRPP